MSDQERTTQPKLPRIVITYCTKCKWLLRAAYYAQELLSTFEASIGEIALVPTAGGIFTVHLEYRPVSADGRQILGSREVLVWDRKAEKGFPETKILKQKIRNFIEPDRNLGHSDTPSARSQIQADDEVKAALTTEASDVKVVSNDSDQQNGTVECEDCK